MKTIPLVFALVLPVFAGCASGEGFEPDPFPDPATLLAFKVTNLDRAAPPRRPFDVPPAQRAPILAALAPARRDDAMPKGIVLGHLDLVDGGGRAIAVDLYATGEETGAFAVVGSPRSRISYRGGKSADLRRALKAAYEASVAAQ